MVRYGDNEDDRSGSGDDRAPLLGQVARNATEVTTTICNASSITQRPPKQFQIYGRRWGMLAIIVLLQIGNAMVSNQPPPGFPRCGSSVWRGRG